METIRLVLVSSAPSPQIVLFWRMLRERFSDEDRVRFLTFVWGRSSLSANDEDYDDRFR